MSFFGTILEKLGLRKHGAPDGKRAQNPSQDTSTRGSPTTQRSSPTAGGAGATAPRTAPPATESGKASGTVGTPPSPQTTPAASVDVAAQLGQLAAQHPEKFNWRTSIVDLLKLLDIDSSLAARKELADELGAPADLKDGSAEMNVWLHRKVLQKIAENGGKVPAELLS